MFLYNTNAYNSLPPDIPIVSPVPDVRADGSP